MADGTFTILYVVYAGLDHKTLPDPLDQLPYASRFCQNLENLSLVYLHQQKAWNHLQRFFLMCSLSTPGQFNDEDFKPPQLPLLVLYYFDFVFMYLYYFDSVFMYLGIIENEGNLNDPQDLYSLYSHEIYSKGFKLPVNNWFKIQDFELSHTHTGYAVKWKSGNCNHKYEQISRWTASK